MWPVIFPIMIKYVLTAAQRLVHARGRDIMKASLERSRKGTRKPVSTHTGTPLPQARS